MTLTKLDIINHISERMKRLGYNKNRCTELVEDILDIMKNTMENGEDVLISGFGKFCVKQKSERQGRNPATDKPLMLSSRKVVTFKCSGKLRKKLNGGV